MDTIITLVIVLIIIGAILSLELKDLLSSVISLGVAGYGISVIFLLLGAPDLAITQIVVEIMTLVILIRAMVVRDTTRVKGIDAVVLGLVGVFAIGSFIYFSALAVAGFPSFGGLFNRMVSSTYVSEALVKTGAANIVSSIILDYRAIDTLGEATILFAASVGVVAVMRKRARSNVKNKTP